MNTLGPCVGKAHVEGKGMALVFDDPESPNYFTVLISRTGARLRRRRDQIDWRLASKKREELSVSSAENFQKVGRIKQILEDTQQAIDETNELARQIRANQNGR